MCVASQWVPSLMASLGDTSALPGCHTIIKMLMMKSKNDKSVRNLHEEQVNSCGV